MRFSKFGKSGHVNGTAFSLSSIQKPGLGTLFTVPAMAMLMMLPMTSNAGTLLQNGSNLVFTGDATVGAVGLTWLCDAPVANFLRAVAAISGWRAPPDVCSVQWNLRVHQEYR